MDDIDEAKVSLVNEAGVAGGVNGPKGDTEDPIWIEMQERAMATLKKVMKAEK